MFCNVKASAQMIGKRLSNSHASKRWLFSRKWSCLQPQASSSHFRHTNLWWNAGSFSNQMMFSSGFCYRFSSCHCLHLQEASSLLVLWLQNASLNVTLYKNWMWFRYPALLAVPYKKDDGCVQVLFKRELQPRSIFKSVVKHLLLKMNFWWRFTN